MGRLSDGQRAESPTERSALAAPRKLVVDRSILDGQLKTRDVGECLQCRGTSPAHHRGRRVRYYGREHASSCLFAWSREGTVRFVGGGCRRQPREPLTRTSQATTDALV